MNFISSYHFEPEHSQAIEEARGHVWETFFNKSGVRYMIKHTPEWEFIVSALKKDGTSMWSISDNWEHHYYFRVDVELRWNWIGKVLFHTKQALSGILQFDWSHRYSRILFMIKRGYIPKKIISGSVHRRKEDTKISAEEFDILIQWLQRHVDRRFTDLPNEDDSPVTFRLKYSPDEARKFLQKNNLE